jgi:hypothetical protein
MSEPAPDGVDLAVDDARSPLPDVAPSADERTTLVEFLEYQRAVFLRKVEGLDEQQVRVRVASSTIDLLGLTRHLVDVERWWFRGVFTEEVTEAVYDVADDPDADWHHGPTDTLASALVDWHREVGRAREIVDATADVGQLSSMTTSRRGQVSLRWILVHMIEEYARHLGHADFIREAIDGTVDD